MRLPPFHAVLPLALLAACQPSPDAQLAFRPGASFTVTQIDGRPAPEGVTLEIAQSGRIAGRAPCNRYFASFTASGPVLVIETPGVTRMACLDPGVMAAETAFLTALEGPRRLAPGPLPGQLALREGTRTRLLLKPAD